MAMTTIWVEELKLSDFRNYRGLKLDLAPAPVVIVGPNGAGKTNLLEAVSLLAPGRGLRRVAYPDLANSCGAGGWAVAATVHTTAGKVHIGTGLDAGTASSERTGRLVRINHQPVRGSGALADYLEMVWLTPAMDGLFTGPAGDRRRFLDRLILCFDPSYRTRVSQFERAMRQRNRLLESDATSATLFDGLELQMAELGVAIAAARMEAVRQIEATIDARRHASPGSPFPWATLAIEGTIEVWLCEMSALDAEEAYRRALGHGRARDRAAKRTLEGPHRSDLIVGHGPKSMPAKLCSTGEQKALLINLVLAHAALVGGRKQGAAPILLLDEIVAHLDISRRTALFNEIISLETQAWLTGTDRQAFEPILSEAQLFFVEDAEIVE